MHVSASIRSPLRDRDSWPASGPVYAVPAASGRLRRSGTLWMKILDRLSARDDDEEAPVSPVYY